MITTARILYTLVLVAGLTTGQADPSDAKTTPREGVVLKAGLRYGTHAKAMLDLAIPQGDGPFPLVVVLHGTGPFSEGRKGTVPVALELARKGYAAAAVEFRFGAADGWLAPQQDAAAALRWLRANAAVHRLDGRRIAVLGYSGGGAVANLLGWEKPGASVQAIAAFSAPSDLAELHRDCCVAAKSDSFLLRLQGHKLKSLLEEWIGGTPEAAAERYRRLSPILHVGSGGPPVLLVHGTKDTVVPCLHSQRLAEKIRDGGGAVRLVLLDGGHSFDNFQNRVGMQAVELFLADTIGKKEVAASLSR